MLRDPLLHGGNGFLDGEAVEEVGVDHDAGIVLQSEGALGHVAALDHLHDGQAEGGGEVPVALVMAGHAHDDAGAVAHQHVVGNENGDVLAGDGMDGLDALQPDAGLVLVQLAALEVGLPGGLLPVCLHSVPVGQLVLPLGEIGMLGRDDHIGHAEQGVAPGGVNGQLIAVSSGEVHLGTFAAADPVALLNLDPLDIVHIVQIVDQTVGILGDGQHPLALFLADDLAAAALADALHNFLVGQHALAAGAPVHGHGCLIGKALLEQLEEDPLGPLVVAGVRGVHHPVPVEGIAQHVKLLGEVGDVLLGNDGRMDVVLDGVVLRGQAKGIKADGEQHIVALHPLFPADDVHSGKGAGMAHMEPLTRGIRELNEAVKLFTGLVAGHSGKGLFLQPLLLPFLFNGCKIVLHG